MHCTDKIPRPNASEPEHSIVALLQCTSKIMLEAAKCYIRGRTEPPHLDLNCTVVPVQEQEQTPNTTTEA
jgi:hypothetical protein